VVNPGEDTMFNARFSSIRTGAGDCVVSFSGREGSPFHMERRAMSLKIFIVSEHADLRRRIRGILAEQREWKICGETSTGAEAAGKVSSLRPEVLLLDLTMPDMDAEEVVAEIKKVRPSVRIIALASHDSGELAVKALNAGASGIAMKSDPAKDLLLTVRNIAKDHPFFSSAAQLCIKKHVQKEIKNEIRQLRQYRDAIDIAIADFERLISRSDAKSAKSENLVQMKRKYRSAKHRNVGRAY
jgi:DNA-binding NarL/FixJ family response regulator